jgi:DNA-binding transcriptional regulator GbsR (MarR family)
MKELYNKEIQKKKAPKTKFMKELNSDPDGFKFQDSIDRIKSKMTKTLSSNDEMLLKYAKLEMIPDGSNAIFIFIEDTNGDENVELALAIFLFRNR